MGVAGTTKWVRSVFWLRGLCHLLMEIKTVHKEEDLGWSRHLKLCEGNRNKEKSHETRVHLPFKSSRAMTTWPKKVLNLR